MLNIIKISASLSEGEGMRVRETKMIHPEKVITKSFNRIKNYSRPVNTLRNKAITKVNIAEPITAHTMGKDLPSIVISKKCGNPIFDASHKPM
jgi:hypothetical protein